MFSRVNLLVTVTDTLLGLAMTAACRSGLHPGEREDIGASFQ